jgi:uncharacterized protein (TIGR02147 family)
MKARKTVFEYDNYRTFLRDFYLQEKAVNPRFSLRFFSKAAGFKSHSVLKLVMEGERDIAPESIAKFSKALKLNKEESVFFRNLVLFNQSKSADEKQGYALEMIRSRKFKLIYPMKESQYYFYANWYLTPLRELVTLPNFQEDPSWISEMMAPRITPQEAASGIQELIKMGLLKRDARGKLLQTDAIISTADEVTSSAVVQYHKQMMTLASESIERFPREARDISAQAFGISERNALEIKEMIQKFRKDVMEVVARDQVPELIYQLNYQLFPLTNLEDRKKK